MAKTRLTGMQILSLFLLKVAAALAYGYIAQRFYGNESDAWDFNRQGWIEHNLLLSNPKEYFTNIFTGHLYGGYDGVFSGTNSFWNDLKTNIILKILSVTNFIARGNYYVNALFFCTASFIGSVALYHVFSKVYPSAKKAAIIGCFLLPSTIFFTSAVSKDAIAFFCIGILLSGCYSFLYETLGGWKKTTAIVVSGLLLFLLKSHYLLLAIPPFAAAYIIRKFRWNRWVVFASVYMLFFMLFFGINSIIPSINPPNAIAQRQADFFTLAKGSSDMATDTLQPTVKSFIQLLPQAIDHSFLRPYPTQAKNIKNLPAVVELTAYWILTVVFLLYRNKKKPSLHKEFIIMLISFAVTSILLTGYITPNMNTIFRYRSLFWPLLITPFLCQLSFEKLRNIFALKK